MTESFEDAIKALRHIARGNGAVMRIADRIVAAHERETKVEGVCGPITGELRGAWMVQEADTWMFDKERFTQLCDAIDSIHAQLERENASLKAELDRVLGEDERDGWPKDADGVPIRFKDKVTVPWSDKVYEVSGFSYQENVHTGTMTIWINTHIDGEYRALCATDSCHHHLPDTWERIIADAMGCMPYEVEEDDDLMDLVARCKKLAGDAE